MNTGYPAPGMMFPGVVELLRTYQARAEAAGVDPLGHYMAPLAYAQLQVLAQAVEATGSLDDADLSTYTRAASFDTVMGTVRFGSNGEWDTPRVLQVQFDGIKGHGADQFRSGVTQLTVSPAELASATLRYPYAGAIKPRFVTTNDDTESG